MDSHGQQQGQSRDSSTDSHGAAARTILRQQHGQSRESSKDSLGIDGELKRVTSRGRMPGGGTMEKSDDDDVMMKTAMTNTKKPPFFRWQQFEKKRVSVKRISYSDHEGQNKEMK